MVLSQCKQGFYAAMVIVLGLAVLAVPHTLQAQEAAVFAGTLLDQDIEDEQGEKVGEVDDLVIKRSGRVKKVTLEVGGFMDIGDKLVAVSYNNFGIAADGNLKLDASVEQLNKKSEFDYYRQGLQPEYYYSLRSRRMRGYPPTTGYTEVPRDTYPSPAYRHSRRHPYARGAYPPSYPPGPYDYGQTNPYTGPLYYEWALSPNRYLASMVVNRGLVTEEGQDLGFVEDLIIDTNKHVEKLIVSSEEYLGEEVYAAIDYEPIKYNPYGIVMDMSVDEFKKLAPYPYEQKKAAQNP